MRVVRFTLVLLTAVALSLSFALPAEDVLETAYDESEALPYESTPPYFVMQDRPTLAPALEFLFQVRREPKGEMPAERLDLDAYLACKSLIVLDHSFRC